MRHLRFMLGCAAFLSLAHGVDTLTGVPFFLPIVGSALAACVMWIGIAR